MELLLLLLIPIMLLIDYVIARKFEKIAFDKGYDESIHSFAMCFLLGIIGYLYVIALPQQPKNESRSEASAIKNLSPPIEESSQYECDGFSVTGKQSSGYCLTCGKRHGALRCCQIRTGVDVREAFLCDECIKIFLSKR